MRTLRRQKHLCERWECIQVHRYRGGTCSAPAMSLVCPFLRVPAQEQGKREHLRNTEDNDEESSNPEGATLTYQHSGKYKAKVTDKMSKQPCMEDSTIIEHLRNTEDNAEESFNDEGATLTFQHYMKYKAKVTDKMGKQLRKEDSTFIDTLDIHTYAFVGTVTLKPRPTLESPSTLKKFPEDNMLLGRAIGIGVALSLSGTNSYLACETPPSLTLEMHEKAPVNVDDDSGKRILFWLRREGKWSKFESVLHPGYYLCTRTGKKPGSLELSNNLQLIENNSDFQVSK